MDEGAADCQTPKQQKAVRLANVRKQGGGGRKVGGGEGEGGGDLSRHGSRATHDILSDRNCNVGGVLIRGGCHLVVLRLCWPGAHSSTSHNPTRTTRAYTPHSGRYLGSNPTHNAYALWPHGPRDPYLLWTHDPHPSSALRLHHRRQGSEVKLSIRRSSHARKSVRGEGGKGGRPTRLKFLLKIERLSACVTD
jgi:hypothetical protein